MLSNSTATANTPIDYRVVALLSLLLSIWLISIDPLINRDAIIYLRSADAYLLHGFGRDHGLLAYPLISILMGILHQLTGLSLLHAGLLLTSLFYALFCVAFVACVQTLGGDRRVQWIAAVVALSHPMLNDQRSSIMRDPAYFSLILLAFRALLLYVRQPTARHQLSWTACIVLAMLFRFEGVFFALLAPGSLLFTRQLPHKLKHCLRLFLPQLAVVGVLVVTSQTGSDGDMFPSLEVYINGLLAIPTDFEAISQATGAALLEFTSRDDAPAAVIAGLGAILVLNICRAITWPYVLVLLWGRVSGMASRLRPDDRNLLLCHLAISLAYLALFTLINRFLLERYANQLVVLVLLFLPFVLNALLHDADQRWKKALAILLLAGMCLDSVHNKDAEKAFIRDAAEWIAEYTPQEASLASNHKYIAYFSERNFDWKFASSIRFNTQKLLSSEKHWRSKDFLAVVIKRRDQWLWEQFVVKGKLREIAQFDGGRHGSVYIVQIQ